jgi:hypothetical protein
MDIATWVSIVVGLAGTASGWFFAWRARGDGIDARVDANAMADGRRIAEAKTDAMLHRAEVAEAGTATATMQLKAAQATIGSLQLELQRTRLDKDAIYEKLAKLGAPVGDALYDSATSRLYANRDRRPSSGSASTGAGGGANPLPTDPPTVAGKPAAKT